MDTNNQSNGTLKKPQIDAFPDVVPYRQKASSSNPLGSLFSVATRLLLWYTVLTTLFRCPTSALDLSDDSPQICKPYLQLRSQAAPYVQPYYDAYLKPYADRAQPHVDNLNEKVITPATIFAKQQYAVYGAPRVAQLQTYAEGTWTSTIKPRLETRRKWARNQYEGSLAPYVDKAKTVTDPYVSEAYHEITGIYDTTIIPLYQRALPYLQDAFIQGRYLTTEIVFPNIQRVQHASYEFLSRNLWPQLVILYGENVEPQLTKISERLGRYKDSKKLQAAVHQVDVSASMNMAAGVTSVPSSVVSSVVSSVAPSVKTSPKVKAKSKSPSPKSPSPAKSSTPAQAATPEKAATPVRVASPEMPLSPERAPTPEVVPTPKKAATPERSPSPEPVVEVDSREKIDQDLKNWQDKFAVAANTGAIDLKLRVNEITSRQIENQAQGVGKALVVQLEETAKSKTEALMAEIIKVVKTLPEEIDDKAENAAAEQIVTEVRNAGTAIKDKAQAIRTWKSNYDQDTSALVNAALESTLKIIDSIRDLGLQQIGMRWAHMEGVTYEDWSNYHDLRSEFDGWRKGVEDAALLHEGLISAKEEGDKVQDVGMKEAQKTVSELVRLRDIAKWKIAARDTSDDFTSRAVPPKAKRAVKSVLDKATGAAKHSQHPIPILSQVSKAFDGASDEAGSVADAASSTAVAAVDDSLESAASLSAAAASKVGDVSASLKPSLGSVLSAAKFKTDQASSAIIGTPPPTSESILSEASSSAQSVSSAIADKASTASNKVFGGAMAAHVEEKHIILDSEFVDDDTFSDRIQSMVSAAGEKASDLTSAVSEAMKSLNPTSTQGSVESVTSVASEKYVQAMSAASAALFGTTPGVVESASSVAGEKYAQAVTAASYAIYGTPKPVLESIASKASAQYDEAISLAKAQYSKGSIAVAGTPKPAYEEALSSVESAYSDSLAAANSKLGSLMGHTASITNFWAKPTQGTFESISSAASIRLQQGLSQASAQYESAKIAVGAQPAPVHQQYLAEAQKQYYQGLGLAHDQYSRFLTAASTAVYGTPTTAYESALSAAQTQYSGAVGAAQSKYDEILSAANAVVGKSIAPSAQSLLDSASLQYEAARLQAAEALSAASASASSVIYGTSTGNAEYLASAASEQLYGTETPWTEAAASQASANWEALISKASSQIYGTSTPWHENAYAQAGGYAAQATEAAAAQYAALAGLFGELVVGKEPDFTESVMNRLSAAYYTGMPGYAYSASSVASEYASSATSAAGEIYASAASVVTSVFTPPPTLEAIIQQASDQLNSAVDAASVQIYGTEPGMYEKATSAAAGAYETAGSKVSEAVYGTPLSYLESAQAGFGDIGANAQKAISEAIYGTPTGTVEAVGSSAAGIYSSVASVAGESVAAAGEAVKDTYSAASAKVSVAIYGPEQSALESAQSRVANAIESARSKIAELSSQATGAAADGVYAAKSSVEEYASSLSSAAASIKDEL